MPAAKISREEILDRIAEVFRTYGYDGTSLRLISKATGLGKASMYHYFPEGKEEMLLKVLEHLGKQIDANILSPLRGEGTPEQRLKAWTKGVSDLYDRGCKNCLLGSIVLSGASDRFSEEMAGAFRALINALASLLEDAKLSRSVAKQRAVNALSQIQGSLIVSRGLGDESHFQQILKGLPSYLLAKA